MAAFLCPDFLLVLFRHVTSSDFRSWEKWARDSQSSVLLSEITSCLLGCGVKIAYPLVEEITLTPRIATIVSVISAV